MQFECYDVIENDLLAEMVKFKTSDPQMPNMLTYERAIDKMVVWHEKQAKMYRKGIHPLLADL